MPLISPETIQNSHPPKGKRSSLLRRYIKLENDRTSWRSHWMELSDYLLPRRGRFLYESQNTRGKKRNNKIIDSTGTQALRTLGAGLMTGMTSPSRPWFRWTPAGDPDLAKNHVVKVWLNQVETVCRGILQRSNFYNTAYTVYTELGGFGTAPLYRQKSFDTVIRFRPFTAGEYVIAENDEGKVDTVGRHFTMTVAQVVRRFVQDKYTDKMDWSGTSRATKRMWKNQQYDDLVPVIHMMQPRNMMDRDGKGGALDMPFASCYFEEGSESDKLLQESGYAKLPCYVPRWDVLSGDMYGRGPGMDTLGDIKQLQHQQKRKAQAIDKMVDPPMVAPTSMRGKPSSVLPGHTTYVDPQQGGGGFVPAYQVTPRIGEMQQDIAEVQERIQRGFYADLFAMMINSDRRQMTATEVAERHEEKLVLLGPVLQRLNIELLDPLLDDVFEFALEAGLLPDPPAALLNTDLKIEYVSLLAQAQQAVGASSLERTMGFAGNLAGVFPEVADVLDADYAIRQYSEILGNDPELVKDEGVVRTLRDDRAAAQQQAAQAEQAASAAQSAKVLSEADTQNPNALTDLLGSGSTLG